jgi:uncharacterized protein
LNHLPPGLVFKDAHPLNEFKAGRWPEDAAYPGLEYRRSEELGLIIERDVSVPLRDGTIIYVDLYRPAHIAKAPALIGWSPYGKHSPQVMGQRPGTGVDSSKHSKFTAWEAPDPVWWGERGYALILPDPRGTWHSEGDASFWNHAEAQDEYDLIEWAGVQPWSSGKIGLSGVSYLAISQWFVASHQPPHLAAINPWEGFSDMYREVCYHGGIPENGWGAWWQEGVEFGLRRVEDLPATAAQHPLFDDYWQSKMIDFSRITVPAYVVASWADQGLHTRGTFEAFKGLGSSSKWLEIHGRKKWGYYYEDESLRRQLAFFDTFLKGEDRGIASWPKVRYEVRDACYVGEFHAADAWPLTTTANTAFYLDAADQTLDRQPPASASTVAYDCAADGEDYVEFDLRFSVETTIVGPAKLRIWIDAEGSDDADLFISLEKFDAGGAHVDFPFFAVRDDGPVALGWLRASHRELDVQRTTELQPWHYHRREDRLRPGEIVPLDIEIWPSGTRFASGETLRLVIGASDRRTYARLPYMRHSANRNAGRHVIYAGGEYDSFLLLPIVPTASTS